uniref:Phosphopantetheine adenylyltransferase n=1 Tax=candidate division WOR-3 bacterium TaxID=2052148 RepID=A0A7C4CDB4_UNCW3
MKTAIYPGSFDPITLGHLDVVKRAAKLFDRVIVAVAQREEKHPLFPWEERVELARAAAAGIRNVRVEGFDCLLVDYVRQKRACAVVRGMRAVMDFDYEFQMALTNRKLAPEIETIFFLPSEKFFYLSASLLRELAAKGGELRCFAPEPVLEALRRKFGAEPRRARRVGGKRRRT